LLAQVDENLLVLQVLLRQHDAHFLAERTVGIIVQFQHLARRLLAPPPPAATTDERTLMQKPPPGNIWAALKCLIFPSFLPGGRGTRRGMSCGPGGRPRRGGSRAPGPRRRARRTPPGAGSAPRAGARQPAAGTDR